MRIFIKLANDDSSEKTCSTLNCTGFNPNGPGGFRTQAENPDSQTFYFNLADDDHRCNVFISKRINKDLDNNEIYFEIEGVKSQMNNKTFSAEAELKNLSENGISNDGSSQFRFGVYNTGDKIFVRKARFKSTRKSARPKFLFRR